MTLLKYRVSHWVTAALLLEKAACVHTQSAPTGRTSIRATTATDQHASLSPAGSGFLPMCSSPDPSACTDVMSREACHAVPALAMLCPGWCGHCNPIGTQTALPDASTLAATGTPIDGDQTPTATSLVVQETNDSDQDADNLIARDRTLQVVVVGLILVVLLNVLLMLIIVCRKSYDGNQFKEQRYGGRRLSGSRYQQQRSYFENNAFHLPPPLDGDPDSDFALWRTFAGRSKYDQQSVATHSRAESAGRGHVLFATPTIASSGSSNSANSRLSASTSPNPPPRTATPTSGPGARHVSTLSRLSYPDAPEPPPRDRSWSESAAGGQYRKSSRLSATTSPLLHRSSSLDESFGSDLARSNDLEASYAEIAKIKLSMSPTSSQQVYLEPNNAVIKNSNNLNDREYFRRPHYGLGGNYQRRNSRRPPTYYAVPSEAGSMYEEPRCNDSDLYYRTSEEMEFTDDYSREYEYADVPASAAELTEDHPVRNSKRAKATDSTSAGIETHPRIRRTSSLVDIDRFSPPMDRRHHMGQHGRGRGRARGGKRPASHYPRIERLKGDKNGSPEHKYHGQNLQRKSVVLNATHNDSRTSGDDFEKELEEYLKEQQSYTHSDPGTKPRSQLLEPPNISTEENNSNSNSFLVGSTERGNAADNQQTPPKEDMSKRATATGAVRRLKDEFDFPACDETGMYANTAKEVQSMHKPTSASSVQSSVETENLPESIDHLYDIGGSGRLPQTKQIDRRSRLNAVLNTVINPAMNVEESMYDSPSVHPKATNKRATLMDPFNLDINARRKPTKTGKKSATFDLSESLPSGIMLST